MVAFCSLWSMAYLSKSYPFLSPSYWEACSFLSASTWSGPRHCMRIEHCLVVLCAFPLFHFNTCICVFENFGENLIHQWILSLILHQLWGLWWSYSCQDSGNCHIQVTYVSSRHDAWPHRPTEHLSLLQQAQGVGHCSAFSLLPRCHLFYSAPAPIDADTAAQVWCQHIKYHRPWSNIPSIWT